MDEKKNTLVKLYGLDRCEVLIDEETARAVTALDAFEDRTFLTDLAHALAHRDH